VFLIFEFNLFYLSYGNVCSTELDSSAYLLLYLLVLLHNVYLYVFSISRFMSNVFIFFVKYRPIKRLLSSGIWYSVAS
jgi:hypothetical protein